MLACKSYLLAIVSFASTPKKKKNRLRGFSCLLTMSSPLSFWSCLFRFYLFIFQQNIFFFRHHNTLLTGWTMASVYQLQLLYLPSQSLIMSFLFFLFTLPCLTIISLSDLILSHFFFLSFEEHSVTQSIRFYFLFFSLCLSFMYNLTNLSLFHFFFNCTSSLFYKIQFWPRFQLGTQGRWTVFFIIFIWFWRVSSFN